MATNRADTLDPALLRPGRLDRKIEFPLPSRREKRLIFQTCTNKMNLGPDVDLEDCKAFSFIHSIYCVNFGFKMFLDQIGCHRQKLRLLSKVLVCKVRAVRSAFTFFIS